MLKLKKPSESDSPNKSKVRDSPKTNIKVQRPMSPRSISRPPPTSIPVVRYNSTTSIPTIENDDPIIVDIQLSTIDEEKKYSSIDELEIISEQPKNLIKDQEIDEPSTSIDNILEDIKDILAKNVLHIKDYFYSSDEKLYIKVMDGMGSYLYIVVEPSEITDKQVHIDTETVDLHDLIDLDDDYAEELSIINMKNLFNTFIDDSDGIVIITSADMKCAGSGYTNHRYIPVVNYGDINDTLPINLIEFYRDLFSYYSSRYSRSYGEITKRFRQTKFILPRFDDKLKSVVFNIEKSIVSYLDRQIHTKQEIDDYYLLRYNKALRLDMMFNMIEKRRELDRILTRLDEIENIRDTLLEKIDVEMEQYEELFEYNL